MKLTSLIVSLNESIAFNKKNTESKRKSARKAYIREIKLYVVSWFFNDGKRKIDKNLVRKSVRAEDKIRTQKVVMVVVASLLFPSREEELHEEFKTMR